MMPCIFEGCQVDNIISCSVDYHGFKCDSLVKYTNGLPNITQK